MSESKNAEMQMRAFRMMRSERYRNANALLKAMQEDFPNDTLEDIKRAIGTVAKKLLENME